MDSEKTTLEHVELNEADLSDEIIQEFDCGNDDMNEYLYDYARDDSVYGRGVTYVLVADDRKRIYAYATLKTFIIMKRKSDRGLLCYGEPDAWIWKMLDNA